MPNPASPHLFVVYDERANPLAGTDYAAVLVSEHKECAAIRSEFYGYVWRYDVAPNNNLVNETFIGPTRRLEKRQQEASHA